jgi:hypothetical protein
MDPQQAPDDGNLLPETGPVTGVPASWVPRMPKDSTNAGYAESWKISGIFKLETSSIHSLLTSLTHGMSQVGHGIGPGWG